MSAIGGMQRGGATRSAPLNLILQEMALALALTPTGLRLIFKHIPGSHNEWADALSRLTQPGSGAHVPGPLRHLERTDVEDRSTGFWKTAGPPEEVLQSFGDEAGQLQEAAGQEGRT